MQYDFNVYALINGLYTVHSKCDIFIHGKMEQFVYRRGIVEKCEDV